ncbi:hypothetical protein [Brevibacterium marinum]|uniref:Uncharacterized protein n=1 Tax=Brevibacterium marinum TaxID=418643 RepID=A0A846RZK3_9MICO|nr:hypothetical protein [Brevibacterium marinum]NJC56620.1 hypothetical protein [Brevibacterium marinum]
MPCTTVERTIADLIESYEDLSLVADAFGDTTFGKVDFDHLRAILGPLANRNGFEDGSDFVHFLMTGSSELEYSVLTSLLAGPLKPLMDSIRPQLPRLVLNSPSSPVFQKAVANIMKNASPNLMKNILGPSRRTALGVPRATQLPGKALSKTIGKTKDPIDVGRDGSKSLIRQDSGSDVKSNEEPVDE